MCMLIVQVDDYLFTPPLRNEIKCFYVRIHVPGPNEMLCSCYNILYYKKKRWANACIWLLPFLLFRCFYICCNNDKFVFLFFFFFDEISFYCKLSPRTKACARCPCLRGLAVLREKKRKKTFTSLRWPVLVPAHASCILISKLLRLFLFQP